MSSASVEWSREEEKAFENAIAIHWTDDSNDQNWSKFASMVPNKTIEELKQHYEVLVEDVTAIEAGNVPIPKYVGEEASSSSTKDFHGSCGGVTSTEKRLNCGFGSGYSGLGQDPNGHGGKGEGPGQNRREEKGFHGQKKSIGCFCWVWKSLGKGTGGAFQETS